MEAQLNSLIDAVFGVLELFFEHRWVAPFVMAPVMFIWAAALWGRATQRLAPYFKALDGRISALGSALGSDREPAAERASFYDQFDAVKEAMSREERGAKALVLAWREFHESIVDETANPICNTARPSAFFPRAVPRPIDLAFASNIFVAVGLVLTFLGIVVALNKTAQGMAAGSDVAQTQDALRALLTIASVKFFTSIAGVGCSIMLRFAEAGLTKKIDAKCHQLCDLLEQGLLYVPPQLFAARQLDELKRQSTQLEKFNTDLALQIGEQVGAQFHAAVSPLAASLGQLNDNMGGMSERLGEGVGKAIEGAASGELRALGLTLNALREQLEGLTGHVQGSGEEAARQIRAAGTDFAQAAHDIREAFGRLSAQVENLGGQMATESEAAVQRQREAMTGAIAAFSAANDEAARGLRDSLDALQGAGASAARQLNERLGEAIAAGAGEAEGVIRRAIEDTGSHFAAAGEELSAGVRQAATQMQALAQAMKEAEQGTAANAENLKQTADGVRTVTSALGQAATGFAAAASPVAEASKSFRDAADRIGSATQRSEEAVAATLKQIGELAAGIDRTQESATEAWTDYRQRFADVDKSLERTIVQITGALESSLADFREFALNVDTQMAAAIGRLAPVVDTIRDNSEDIAEFAQSLRNGAKAAAE